MCSVRVGMCASTACICALCLPVCMPVVVHACMSVCVYVRAKLGSTALPVTLCRQLWVGGAWMEDTEPPWAAEVSVLPPRLCLGLGFKGVCLRTSHFY